MLRRLLPSPALSITLLVVWVVLNQSLQAATVLLGVLLAIALPLLTQALRPARVRLRHPAAALRLLRASARDLVAGALAVAWRLLTRRNADIRSRFVQVPLRLRDPNGLAVLAMALNLSPGTAWAELAPDRSVLLIHVFDLADEAAFIARVRQRYEAPLMAIFQSGAEA